MDSQENIFAARTGNQSQVALRGAYRTIQRGGPSQQIEYDMTGGWVFQHQVDISGGEALLARQHE
jgi:hypothetical protein